VRNIQARRGSALFVVVVAAAGLAACGGHRTGAEPKLAAGPVVPATGGACKAASSARPIGTPSSGASLALARVGDKRVAFVADEDARAILTVDLDARTLLAQTPLGASPSQVLVGADGRVFATLRDKNELVVLTASRAELPLARVCGASTASEPIAIAATPDGASLLVTSGWGQRLTAFDASTLAVKLEAKLGREPRAVVVSDDGRTAFVSHAVGSVVSTVDLAGAKHEVKTVSMRGFDGNEMRGRKFMLAQLAQRRKANPDLTPAEKEQFKRIEEGRPSCQGFALAKSAVAPGRIFAPEVLVDAGDFERRPDGYGDQSSETEVPTVAVIDETAATTLMASIVSPREVGWGRIDVRDATPPCLLPRAAAVDPQSKSLLVTCYGIDAVVAYDATAANPLEAERRRWVVGSGPSGVAVDVEKHTGVVWAQFDRTLTTFALGGSELVDDKTSPLSTLRTQLPALEKKLPTDYALGRILFHAAGDARVSADGRACASCHPDGRDDAITWATPEGPRRTIMLAGRVASTAPYSWNGNAKTIPEHMGNTFDRLSGKGLRSVELDALVAYVTQMPVPHSAPPADAAKIERGRQIFASKETACASCHSGTSFTDGVHHDVGSRHKADRSGTFNTPSLHLVGGTGPYFHDGRYASLGELLQKSDGTMGHTKHLSPNDLGALEAYLGTL
jgi:DNA-binding beta-propeller fold protein YncE/mono/diheme cytochrome c family protein